MTVANPVILVRFSLISAGPVFRRSRRRRCQTDAAKHLVEVKVGEPTPPILLLFGRFRRACVHRVGGLGGAARGLVGRGGLGGGDRCARAGCLAHGRRRPCCGSTRGFRVVAAWVGCLVRGGGGAKSEVGGVFGRAERNGVRGAARWPPIPPTVCAARPPPALGWLCLADGCVGRRGRGDAERWLGRVGLGGRTVQQSMGGRGRLNR